MDQKKLTLVITFVIVVVVSIFLGSAVGRSDLRTPLIAVVVLVTVLIVASLGERTWVLIPIFAAWSGRINVLPIPFSLSNLVVGLSVCIWLLSISVRRQEWEFKFHRYDIVIGLTFAILALGYYRNPVGIAAFAGGGNVGGRAYAEIGISFAAYFLLAGQKTTVAFVEKLPKWILVSACFLAIGGTTAYFLPEVGLILYQFYSGFLPDVGELIDPYAASESIGRAGFLRPLAFALAAYVGVRSNPLLLLKPEKWGLLILLMIATILALISGFRSAMIAVGFYFICASWLWLRGIGLIICSVIATVFLMAVFSVQQVTPLPERVQRSLSFLPGPWDQRVIDDAEGSTEWRLEMWETILEGDAIKNWWIGDGFGIARSEMEYFGALQASGQIRSDQLAEYYMMTGDLHSGPLSAAKYAGIIGGVLFVILAVWVFISWAREWKRLAAFPELSNLRQVVGFFCILASFVPFKFVFVAGFYDRDLPALLVSAGLCRLFSRLVDKEIAGEEDSVKVMPASNSLGYGLPGSLGKREAKG